MTIFGWDASDYDWSRGTMDLVAARRAGIDFFTHKSTEGTSITHSKFAMAMNRAKDAGVPILGAYHVARSPANASAEVDFWLKIVNAAVPWWKDHPCWFWQVDLEKWPYDAVSASEGESVADLIEQRTGRKAVIYASKGQYGDQLIGTSHNLWNARYPYNFTNEDFKAAYTRAGGDKGSGWQNYSGKMTIIWQYTSTARIGSQNTCDANAFRGTVEDLNKLLNGKVQPVVVSEDTGLENDMFMVQLSLGNPPDGVWLSNGTEYWGLKNWTIGKALLAVGFKKVIVTSQEDFDAVAGKPRQDVPGVDVNALADAVVSKLPEGFADKVADVLANRLSE